MCVKALSNLPYHVVLSISDNADPATLGRLPPNFEIVQRTSHTKVLPHASLLIYMGGIISAAEAAYHAVPLLITSCGIPELEGYADNLESIGLGRHLRTGEMTVESLKRFVIETLQSEEIHRNVRQAQYHVHREPGGEETANRIEAHLEKLFATVR
jgi:dTDP-L-oleandrosyltransferase